MHGSAITDAQVDEACAIMVGMNDPEVWAACTPKTKARMRARMRRALMVVCPGMNAVLAIPAARELPARIGRPPAPRPPILLPSIIADRPAPWSVREFNYDGEVGFALDSPGWEEFLAVFFKSRRRETRDSALALATAISNLPRGQR